MKSTALGFLARIARRVWFRASLVSLAAVMLALADGAIQSWLPFTPSVDLGQGSLDSLLQIIASSMLAVTTFSLTAMVTAYSSAASLATPRATQLLVEDTTSQNVLSTFVGAFVYALVGIVALSTGYYGEQGRVVLFFGTLLVIALMADLIEDAVRPLARDGAGSIEVQLRLQKMLGALAAGHPHAAPSLRRAADAAWRRARRALDGDDVVLLRETRRHAWSHRVS